MSQNIIAKIPLDDMSCQTVNEITGIQFQIYPSTTFPNPPKNPVESYFLNGAMMYKGKPYPLYVDIKKKDCCFNELFGCFVEDFCDLKKRRGKLRGGLAANYLWLLISTIKRLNND